MRQVQLQRRAEGQDRRVSGQEEQVWEAVENVQNKVGGEKEEGEEKMDGSNMGFRCAGDNRKVLKFPVKIKRRNKCTKEEEEKRSHSK